MSELKSEYLCTVRCGLAEAQHIGNGPYGVRQIIPLRKGTIKGPKINGEVLPFGADWILVRPDGIIELDVRATIKTDDGEHIYVHYKGLIDQSNGYYRTAPVFETGSEKYSWLNKSIYVGVGQLGEAEVTYEIYKIL